MCLSRGKVIDLKEDLICYKVYREKTSLFGKKYYTALYRTADKKRYKVGKSYGAKIISQYHDVAVINDEKVQCKWFMEKGKKISDVCGGVFHLFRDFQSAKAELNKFGNLHELKKGDGLVIAECIVPRDSKVVIVGTKNLGEENRICSKTIKIRKIVDTICA